VEPRTARTLGSIYALDAMKSVTVAKSVKRLTGRFTELCVNVVKAKLKKGASERTKIWEARTLERNFNIIPYQF
jgi:hypothetical protein